MVFDPPSSTGCLAAKTGRGKVDSTKTAASPRKGGERFFFTISVFEFSHPPRPVLRLDAAGFGPGTGRVEPAMPFQSP